MCRVPVASIEDADHVVVHGGKGLEEADEPMLIVDLVVGWIVLVSGQKGRVDGETCGGLGDQGVGRGSSSPLIPVGKTF